MLTEFVYKIEFKLLILNSKFYSISVEFHPLKKQAKGLLKFFLKSMVSEWAQLIQSLNLKKPTSNIMKNNAYSYQKSL